VSAASRHNLIDMAFTDQSYEIRRMKNFMAGWYYYDAAVILMDHVVSIHHDLRNGIANLSLIAMREKELRDLTSLRNYNPHLTIEDYDGHLRRIADLTSKAIRLATTDVHDETFVYPFMTIMMPVVMMADWIGNRDDMIHTFLEAIAPTIKAVASNGTVPTRAIIEVASEAARGQ
jgi:cytochrome P450